MASRIRTACPGRTPPRYEPLRQVTAKRWSRRRQRRAAKPEGPRKSSFEFPIRHKAPAMLVRGEDTYGHFELEQLPSDDFEAARAAHARYYASYRGNYNEQVALLR